MPPAEFYIIFGIILFALIIIVAIFATHKDNHTKVEATVETEPAETTTSKPKKQGHPFLKFVGVILVLAVTIFCVLKVVDCATQNDGNPPTNTDGQHQLTSRSARNSDINLVQSTDFSLSDTYKLTPNVDISSLQVTIYFLDNSNNVVTSKNKTIGNVSEGVEYSFSFALTEFGFTEIFTIRYWRWEVTGGTVSYFA